MSTSALFKGLSIADCTRIAACAHSRVFRPDEFLFRQGHVARNLMLIQSGTIKVTQLSAGGNEVILWMSGAREAIGLMVDPTDPNGPYACSAQAMEKVSAIVWDYSRWSAYLEEFPSIRANMNAILLARLEELQERFREIATERVAKRLALTLVRLSKQVGRPHQSGIQVLLSRGELAQIVGTTLFTISRILCRWDQDGVVLARREAVVMCNPSSWHNHPDFQ